MTTRRNFLFGSAAVLIGAPAIARAQNLMPLRGIVLPAEWRHFGFVERLYVDVHLRKITDLQNEGLSVCEIAAHFNRCGMQAMSSAAWDAEGIKFVIKRHEVIQRQGLLLRAKRSVCV